MRKACLSVLEAKFISRALLLGALIQSVCQIAGINIPASAQLPPTNMGQYVHQPGDNQYTNATQAERHGPVVAPAVTTVVIPAANTQAAPAYRPTPPAPKPDISLLPIVADEPIKPAGFPPLPDRLDLPTAGSAVWGGANGANRVAVGAGGVGTTIVPNGIPRDPQGVHQHYVHYQAGAFMPDQVVQQNYKPTSADYYNINPNARAGMNKLETSVNVPAETPSMQALKHMGPEPGLAPDKIVKPEAPEAVTVNQSVTQDLSLPEDDFNKHYPTAVQNSASNRFSRRAGSVAGYPARMLLYTGASMVMGAGMYAGMYAVHR